MKKGKILAVGTTGCAGIAAGIVRVIDHDPELSWQLKPGEIMVAAYADPSHTPALKRAAAVITESGGLTSHPVIVARETNTPTVVACSGILDPVKGLKNGQRIIVEAKPPAEGKNIGVSTIYEDLEPAPAIPTAGESLAAKLQKLAAAKGISLNQAFLDKMRNRE